MKKPLLLFLFICTVITPQIAQDVFIYCGKLVDTEEGVIKDKMTVIVKNNVIDGVAEGYLAAPRNFNVIDLKGYTVMPGLMDMHVHLEGQSNPKSYEERFRMNDADVALRSTVYCERTLMAGFTTVRDLGGSGVNISLQTAINRGFISGPRIYTAGKSIATTGGHADPSNGVRKDIMGDPGPKEGVINGPEDARKAVRQRYKNGADLIKITATGGVLSVAKDGSGPQFNMEELEAIIETANDYGMTTAAHAHGAEGMKRAVMAGITSIEHGTMMTEEIMDLMIDRGTYFVPTISAGKFVAEKAKQKGFYPDVIVPKALAIGPKIQETFGKAYRYGVKIAFGTDAGVSYHGDNGKEFVYMVEAGMPILEAIRSATITSAKLLKIDDKLGSIQRGKLADIVAVKGDPREDVNLMTQVEFVMKDGKVYKQPKN
jgi:imidazolonepropionase-like amidohydrolase